MVALGSSGWLSTVTWLAALRLGLRGLGELARSSHVHGPVVRFCCVVVADVNVDGLELANAVLVIQTFLRRVKDHAAPICAWVVSDHGLQSVIEARLGQLILDLTETALSVDCLQQLRLMSGSAHLRAETPIWVVRH